MDLEYPGFLSGGLVLGRNARIADQHCIKVSPTELVMQYRFATPEPLKTRRAADRCTTAPFLCASRGFLYSLIPVFYSPRRTSYL